MRKTVFPLLLFVLIIATLLCLASPGAASEGSTGEGLLEAFEKSFSGFCSLFAGIAEIIMTILVEIWLNGGEGTHCCLGVGMTLIGFLALAGLGAIRTTISAYHKYLE